MLRDTIKYITSIKVPNICSMSQQQLTFSVLVGELKGLDQAHGLLNRASNWEVVDGDLSQDALVVNDEQTPGIDRESSSRVSEDLRPRKEQ